MKKRNKHSPVFMAKVALEDICEEMTLAEVSKKYGVHTTQIGTWKRAAIEHMATAFARKGTVPEPVSAAEVDKLHSKIGQLVVEWDFWSPFGSILRTRLPGFGCLASVAWNARRKMVSEDHRLSLRRQCALLTLKRSNLHYEPKGESAENLHFMTIIE